MAVKHGFKQTEVGVIPEDWQVVPVGLYLRRKPSYGINAPAVSFDSRFPTYLRITDVTEDGRFSEANKVSVEHAAATEYLLEPGDIVFARTGASVGKSYLYDPNDSDLVFAGFLIRVSPDPERLVPAFLSFYAQSRPYWNWVKVNSMRSGQPGINGREYASLPIPLPPTRAEQEAIAEALADVDVLIKSLERLLSKKCWIKQGTIQELLRGKKRLPGFEVNSGYKQIESGTVPVDWQLRPLLSTVRVASGQVDPRAEPYCSMTLVAPDHVESGSGRLLKKETASDQHAISGKYLFARGDIVYSKIRPYLRKAILADFDGLCSADMYPLKPAADISAMFILATILGHHFSMYAESVSVRSGMPKINRAELAEYTVALPPTRAEQESIATILSDMDAEIAALEAKLAKARQIKQGMMQELLTGRIRLV